MRFALLVGVVGVHEDFLARQMSRQALVTLLPRLAAFVLRDDVSLLDGLGQTLSSVGSFSRVTKVDPQLIGVFDIAFALGSETFLPQLQVVFFQLLDLVFELFDHVVALGNFLPLRSELFLSRSELLGLLAYDFKQLFFRKAGYVLHGSNNTHFRALREPSWPTF